MNMCGYCGTWRSRPCGEGCYWGIASNGKNGFALEAHADPLAILTAERDRYKAALELLADLLGDARSGYIAGSEEDERWDRAVSNALASAFAPTDTKGE